MLVDGAQIYSWSFVRQSHLHSPACFPFSLSLTVTTIRKKKAWNELVKENWESTYISNMCLSGQKTAVAPIQKGENNWIFMVKRASCWHHKKFFIVSKISGESARMRIENEPKNGQKTGSCYSFGKRSQRHAQLRGLWSFYEASESQELEQ